MTSDETNASPDEFSEWIGRTEIIEDDVSPATAQAAAATFDEAPDQFTAGAELPPLWHWFYFLTMARQCHLGGDGHPLRDSRSFMPPVPFPRRMLAGARFTCHRPLLIGRPARREAVIQKIVRKSGRSGGLAFVTLNSRILQAQIGDTGARTDSRDCPTDTALCIEEEQDIVYREPGPLTPAPQIVELTDVPEEAWSRTIVPDSRLLFRFSALTFNAHRIHYDRPYATGEEGYPGLVVHGPLTAMLLLQLVRRNTSLPIASFAFRGQSPLFDGGPIRLIGLPSNGRVELQAQGPDGKAAMTAIAEFIPEIVPSCASRLHGS